MPDAGATVHEYRWYHKLFAILGAVLLFEMGVFLIVFPWASEWDLSWFSTLPYWATDVWFSPYFRGAITGLGVVNVWLSFVEVFRLRRFSQPSPVEYRRSPPSFSETINYRNDTLKE